MIVIEGDEGMGPLITEIVEGGWRLDQARDLDIRFLGQKSIQELIRRGRRERDSYVRDIKRVEEALCVLGEDGARSLGDMIKLSRSLVLPDGSRPFKNGSDGRSAGDLGRELKRSKDQLVVAKDRTNQRVTELMTLSHTKRKIHLPICRLPKHFSRGDEVMAYVGNWHACSCPKRWVSGRVGRRNIDEIAILYGSDYGIAHRPPAILSFRYDRPEIMLAHEYAFLINDLEFAAIYAAAINPKLQGFDPDQFLAHLGEERQYRRED